MPMKILLAQGNPGAQYAGTRHNIGWMILDEYTAALGVAFKPEKKFAADIATTTIDGEKVLLVKPTTFYNQTGRTARALVDFYNLDPASDLLVIHDDLSLPFGTIRVRDQGSDAGNNGIKSISAHVGPAYWRIRVGIHNELAGRMDASDFVLSTFGSQEKTALVAAVMPDIIQLVEAFIDGALKATSKHLAP